MTFRSIVSDIPFHPSRVQDTRALIVVLQKRHVILKIAVVASILLLAITALVAITQLFNRSTQITPQKEFSQMSLPAGIVESTQTRNLTNNGSYSEEINASQGDSIEFRYQITNEGSAAQSITLKKDVSDITEYAYIIDASGAKVSNTQTATISWPEITLGPNETTSRTLLVKIMSPLPRTPDSLTSNTAGDFILQSGAMNQKAVVNLPLPATKQVERFVAKLPTMPIAGVLFSSCIFIFVSYFYIRNQILLHESKAIRNTHNAK